MRGHGSSRVVYGRARRVWPAAGASGAVSSPAAAAMADWRAAAHVLAKKKAAFYSRAHSQTSTPCSDVTGALKHGVRRPSACVRGGGPTAPRRARARCVTRGLVGREASWRCVQGWRKPCSRADF
jgi:hypothetical protein